MSKANWVTGHGIITRDPREFLSQGVNVRGVFRGLVVLLALALGTACKGMGDITAPRPVESPVASVVLSSEQLTVGEGSSVALQVTARDADNRPLSDRPATWSSSDSTIARVSAVGLVTGLRPGTVTIAASIDGHSAVARVTIAARAVASVQVTPTSPSLLKGASVQLSARTLDESGAELTGRPVAWSSSDVRIAVVDVTGVVTGVSPGVANVIATSELRSAAVGVTVLPVPVATVQVTPARDTVVLGQSTQLTATPRDSIGAPLDNAVTFSSSAPSVATVSSTGLVVGVATGSATITASSGGKSGTSLITVQPRPVGAVIVSPAQASLTIGQDVKLQVQITDASGNLLTGRPITYSSSNVNVARVSADGTVTATAPGSATITITSEGKTGTASIIVTASPIATLRIDPSTLTLAIGATSRLSAVALDAAGNVLSQRTVAWTSGAPGIVSVGNDGTVTALAAGTAIVFANAEGRIATSTITINPIVATTVVVTSPAPAVIAGQSVDLVATLRGANGQLVDNRLITWTSNNPAVAIVSSTGRLRGVSPGTARIDATADGVTGSLTVSIIPVPVATVTVTLASSSLIVRGTTQASAVARDSTGAVLTGRVVTWSSSNTSVATVSTTGLVTAVALGTANIIGTSETRTGSAPVTVVVGTAATLAANSSTTLSAAAGTAVSESPSVKVTDTGGSPVAGASVIFTVTGGGGTTTPASPATVTTNAAGVATLTTWTLGATIGTNTLTATANGLTGSPITFTATGVVGAAKTIAANSVVTQSAAAGAAVSAPPSVIVKDAGGNVVSGVNVVFAVTAGGGAIVPATVNTNASGIATLTSWTLGATAGTNTVTASVGGLTGSPVTFNATGTAGPAAQLAVITQPAGAMSGSAFTTQPKVEIRDAGGNLTASTASVTASIASGTGTLSGTTTVAAVNGVATFTNLTISGIGPHTLRFASTGLTVATSSSFTVTPGVATKLVMVTQPAGAANSTAFTTQPAVELRDATDNTVPQSGVVVTVAKATGSGTLSGTLTATTDASGKATFANLSIIGTGLHSLTFTSGSLTPVTSASFSVAAGTPTQLAITTQPGAGMSGSALTAQPVIVIRDANGNQTNSTATVTVAVASGTGTLSGTTTIAAVNGVATFTNLAITGTGTHTLRFTSGSLTSVTSSGFTISAGSVSQIGIVTQPGSSVSGALLTPQPVVELRDASGVAVAQSGVIITVSKAAGNGTLSGTLSVATNAAGRATFTDLVIRGTGNHQLRFSSGSLTAATSVGFNMAPGSPDKLGINTQPSGAVSGVAFTTQPVVSILDADGNLTPSTASVTATVSSGTGTLGGTQTVAAVGGVATFTNLSISGTGPHALTFTSGTLTAATSSTFAVAAGAATQLAVTTQPAGAVSGAPFTAQPVIAIRDASGNITSSTASVTVAIASGTGLLSGNTTVTAVNGVATFSNLVVTGSGAHTLIFTSTSLTSATSSSFVVTVPPPTQLAVTTQPGGAVTGTAFTTQPVIAIRDASGNLTNSTANVTVAIASGAGGLSGTTTVAAVNGVATFTNLAITGLGTFTLTFTSAGLSAATSASFSVTAGTPTQLAMITQPSGATSGSAFTTQPVVELRSALNLAVPQSGVVVTVARSAGTGTLSGTLSATTDASGRATFTNLVITGTGAHTLTFSSAGLTGATSASFNVAVAPATQLAVATQPAGAVSGAAFTTQPSVELRNASNGAVAQAGVVITVAKASGSGTLSGTLTATTDATGVATFTNLVITGTGPHTLTFTSGALTAATSASFTVGAAPATQLAMVAQPSGAVSGTPFTTQPTVELRNASNGAVSQSGVVVTASKASGSGTLTGTLTATTDATGKATFSNLEITGTGAHTLTFTATGLTAVTSSSFTVAAGAPSQLTMTTQPSGATSGTAFTTQPVVAIRDADGNLTSSTASITVTIASGSGSLGGTTTVAAVAGVATFTNLVITGSGAHTLTFASAGLTPVTSASINVATAPATQLAMVTQPSGAVSGAAFTTQPVVELRNASNGGVSQSGVVVTVAKASGTGTLSGTLTVTTDVNGDATFTNLVITGTGAHTLSFTATGLSAATSASINVAAAPATQLAMLTQPTGAVSGTPFTTQPVVELRNASNGAVAQPGVVVTAAKASGSGTLSGTLTATTDATGKATFSNLEITGTGAHTLTFTATGLTAVTSSSFTVAAGAPSQLTITTQPSGATSGTAFTTQPVVAIRDADGNLTSSTASITVTIASGGGSLGGTTTVAAVAGVATFTNLVITGSGVHTLTFASAGLTPVTSASINVAAAPATQLAMLTQPTGAVSGTPFTTQPVVELRNASNGAVAQPGVVVTAAKASGSGTLSGTLTATTDATGKATFSNLEITGTGAHTLTFTATGLTAVTSSSFTVAAGAPSQLTMTTQPSGATSGTAFTTQPAVAIRDADGNLTNSTASVTVAIASGSGSLSGNTTVAAVSGVATFTNLAITGSGAHTLTFTSTGLTPVTSSSFSVSAGTATQLAMVTQPAGAVNSVAFTTQPVVELHNAANTVVPQSGVVVTVAKASGSGTLSGTLTATTDATGKATFTNLVITGSGAHTLTFTSGSLTSVTSASFTVAAGTPTQLAVVTQPSGAVSGTPFTAQPAVELRNASNIVVPQSGVVITVAKASGSGTLSGTLTATTDASGKATFTDLEIVGTGTHTLTFTSTGLSAATSSSFNVTAAPATQLTITTQPNGAVSGTAFTTQPVVELRNASNGTVAQSGVTVTVAKATGSGTLSGTLTANTDATGKATFTNLSITGTGAYTLTFSATGLTGATSSSFTVAAGSPSQLSMLTEPAGAVSGRAFTTQPAVAIQDEGGNLTSSTAPITVAIMNGNGTLSGTLTIPAVAGVGRFTDLAITGSGNHKLRFTSAGLKNVSSATFPLAAGVALPMIGGGALSFLITTLPTSAIGLIGVESQSVARPPDFQHDPIASRSRSSTRTRDLMRTLEHTRALPAGFVIPRVAIS